MQETCRSSPRFGSRAAALASLLALAFLPGLAADSPLDPAGPPRKARFVAAADAWVDPPILWVCTLPAGALGPEAAVVVLVESSSGAPDSALEAPLPLACVPLAFLVPPLNPLTPQDAPVWSLHADEPTTDLDRL